MEIQIRMSNDDYLTLSGYADMKDVKEFLDYLHDDINGKQVLKNRLIEFNDSVFFNPSQITGIKIEK
ncbi:hypothetical protein [Bacillus subtilis]|uniref:hypothetical protein n=1 Tax=Bacillus subtilis TaxID=1423 RepID=UPI0004E2B860|nr:hypothetical protein [Bacillus subtilis]KFC31097.1 hypothetical protein ZQL_10895 [Bacillus subtilis]WLD60577.1 hypothetical protein PIB33_15450 [Bacillus subtilis]